MQIIHTKKYRLTLHIIYSAILLFFAFLVILLTNNDTHAEQLDFSVNIKPVLKVTIPSDTVILDVNPTSSGVFATQDLSVKVGSNYSHGYKLYMDANGTELVNSTTSDTIATLPNNASGYTENDFIVNKWGYKLPSTNYLPFVSHSEILSNTTPTNEDSTTVTFAAKVDVTQPAGSYELTLNFVAIPTYQDPTISDMYYMQDFAHLTDTQKAGVLASMTEEEAYTLYDIRDEEDYKVSELKDGNVWMLDNLRFSDSNYIMTEYDTNIAPGTTWKFPHSSGEWAESCTEAYINADGKNEVIAHSGKGEGKAGTYYNFCAASSGTYCYDEKNGASGTEYDVCPASWRIPTGLDSGEYLGLCNSINGETCNPWAIASETFEKYERALSTTLAGFIYNGLLNAKGSGGWFWASTPDSGNMAAMTVNTSTLSPVASFGRMNGFSLRCIMASE